VVAEDTSQRAQTPPADPVETSVWEVLAQRLNPAFGRPVLRERIEVRKLMSSRGVPYYMLKNVDESRYVRLAADEYFLVQLMDGQRQVKDLILAYFAEYRSFAFERIAHLVAQLQAHGFLQERPRDVWQGVRAHLQRRSWIVRAEALVRGVLSYEVSLRNIDRVVTAAYRHGGWRLFTMPARVVWLGLAALGVVLCLVELIGGGTNPLKTGGSYAGGLLTLLVMEIVLASFHESAHALTTKAFGRRVNRGGFMLYFGLPAVFVDTTDIWMEPLRPRLIVSAAGVIATSALGGLAMLGVFLWPGTAASAVLFQFAFAALLSNTFNLLPLIEVDGYYLLMDWLEMPLLRVRSLAFVRHELPRKLRARVPLAREERIFAIYGSLAVVYSAAILAQAVAFWLGPLRGAFDELWQQPDPLHRAVLVVLGTVVGLAVALGLSGFVRRHRGALVGWGGRVRQRRLAVQARSRIDARALVSDLPFLVGRTPAEREHVVNRLTPLTVRAGAYIFHESEPGDTFYVVRSGSAEVLRLNALGWGDTLAVLHPGDYFGEQALLRRQPRLASVRALSRMELFALTRDDFDALLATHLRAAGVTLQRLEELTELSRMSLFRNLSPRALNGVLDALRSTRIPAGNTIVTEGEPGERFFLIREGRVRVVRHAADGTPSPTAELGVGDFFGELALLSDAPRNATVAALGEVTVWSMDRDAFHRLLMQQLRLGDTLTSTAERRKSPPVAAVG
jgi:CRP-like cAMP-binding protein